MTKNVKIPWGAWYEKDEVHLLKLSESWQIQIFDIKDAKAISSSEYIKTAINKYF